MVKEFTELQGVVGGLYARAQGEPEAVAHAIYEHYKPVSMEDSIPETLEGQIVSLADKLDTLRECFRIGMVPTGSKDPFALRRAAQGVVKILVEAKLDYNFSTRLFESRTVRFHAASASSIISAKSAASNTTRSTPCWPPAAAPWPIWKRASQRSPTCAPPPISNRSPPASNASATS